ncbi:MAG: hypothetical protein IJN62_03130 [Clostridia bacterium]|nr:hypothetical protein [Clostridia bacterium]
MSDPNERYVNTSTVFLNEKIDEEEYGYKLDDIERMELDKLKSRIKRRICTAIDEEIKMAVYKLKTGKDFY